MEMTAILVGLVATAGGLVVLVASGLRVVGAHRQGLLAMGVRLADSLHLRWLTGMGRPLSTLAQARRPVWLFGMTAAVGVLLIATTAIGTDRLAEDVTAGDGVAVLDHPVASFVAAHRSGALTTVMRAVSSAGGPLILAAVTVVAGVLLTVLRRSRGPVLLAGATVAGIAVLTITLKEAVGRSRPPLDDALAAAEGHAFPSAHAAAAAAAVFGVLAYLFAARLRSWSIRVAVWAGAAMLTALVGISRIYLGVHWTTDVIGGWAFGVLWLAVVLTSWMITTRHRRLVRKPRARPHRAP
jgi:undecaprenyl-diphosphatase